MGTIRIRIFVVVCLLLHLCILLEPTGSKHVSTSTTGRKRKRVLVTGAAGFIGFHIAKQLAEKGNFVVGFDNFNEFYDVSLKKDRAYELHKRGVKMFQGDLCDERFLESLFKEYKFSDVVHMAAQAGVRYSLGHPLIYVRSNIECHINLVQQLQRYPDTKFVYASSSTVYGKSNTIPFSTGSNVDQPGNMYAASKRTDEILGQYLCETFNHSVVGVRFFTVYGPWGRPDMAVYRFAESIVNGNPVPMYRTSDPAKPLGRDFTYIDDIVDGVLSAMDYQPKGCTEVFNLGKGTPVKLKDMVNILEEELNITATLDLLPLPPTEILQTWADISATIKYLNFSPEISLRQGIKKFVKWYMNYRKQKQIENTSGIRSASDSWFIRLDKSVKRTTTKLKNLDRKSLMTFYENLDSTAHTKWSNQSWLNDRKQRLIDRKNKWNFFQGMSSKGHVIGQSPSQALNEIRRACLTGPFCVAFSTDGNLVGSLDPKYMWEYNPHMSPNEGLYVADVDICDIEAHTCHPEAVCLANDSLNYKCVCKSNLRGDGHLCVPVYGDTIPIQLKQEYLASKYSATSIAELKKGRPMRFFRGKDCPTGSYLSAEKYKEDKEKLKEICLKDPLCVDIDYCLAFPTICPSGMDCKYKDSAEYHCTLQSAHMSTRTR